MPLRSTLVRWSSAVASLLVVVLMTETARAGDPPSPATGESPTTPDSDAAKQAEEHFRRAKQLYDEGDFALALIEFRRAYELSPNYRVLYNIGQVNIQLYNYAAARKTLEKYLEDGGSDISATRKSQVAADLKMLAERTAFLQIAVKPAADVTIDEQPVGKAPFSEPLLVNAGQRKIIVSRQGFISETKVVTLAGGDRKDLRFELAPVPKEGKPVVIVPKTVTSKSYTPAVLGWIGTGTLAIGAGIVGGFYLSKESEIDSMSQPDRVVTRQAAQDAESSATRLAVIADVLGLAAVGAGLASLYFTLRPPQSETMTTGRLRLTPTGVAGTF